MRIWRRPNGYWYAVINGERTSLRTRDKDTAKRTAADLARAPQGDTVAKIMDAYLADKSQKPGIQGMKDAWKSLAPSFGHLRPDQINRETCRKYWAKRKGRSNGTIIKELTTLRAGLRWADRNTPAIIIMPAAPAPRDVFITKKQFQKLLANAVAPHVKVFLSLAWYTAARKEAILSLEWTQIKSGMIHFGRAVGNKGRASLPIHPDLKMVLDEAEKGAVSDYVVERAGDRVGSIRKGFDEAAKRAGMSHITPHDLRRSAARHMVENGVSLHEVSQILGHRSVEMTAKTYARFSPDYLRKAIGVL